MSRIGLAALTVLVIAVGAATSSSAAPAVQTAARSAVQASGSEFRIGLSRRVVRPGSVRVEFVNFGEDDHDLALLRKGSSQPITLPTVKPGEKDVRTVTMRRGTYVLWCTISDHKRRGMRAELKVRTPRR